MVEYSRRELICLHLDVHAKAIPQSPAPRAGTAAGIGDALEFGGSAAERVSLLDELTSLENDGLVTAEERPVTGREAPRTVYSLTGEGHEHAAEVRDRLEAQSVELSDGTSERVPLSDIDRYIEDVDAPLVTAMARLTADGRVPLEQYVGEEFVNHQEPLERVEESILASFRRESQTVFVDGAPGMGKTALIQEAIRHIRDERSELTIARGSCDPEPTAAYEPLREAFDALPNADELLARLDRAQQTVTPEDSDKIEAQRTALFNDIADEVRRAAMEGPIVLFIDNLQWADEATAALFGHLSATIDELVYPVAFVGAYRMSPVTANDDHPLSEVRSRLAGADTLTEVSIEELGKSDTRALLASELGRQRLPERFVSFVHSQTGGNPLFVRETATHLLETDRVDPAEERYPSGQEDVVLPQQVTAQIEQRLAALDTRGQELLSLAAVIGSDVPGRILDAASEMSAAMRREYLDILVAGRLLQPSGVDTDTTASAGDEAGITAGGTATNGAPAVAADGSGNFRFVSDGIREAVLGQSPDEQVKEYHGRVADAFLGVHGADLEGQAARVAHHYEQAEETAEAVTYYRQAAEQAKNAYANEHAIENYRRAIDLGTASAAVDSADVAAMRRELADIYRLVGDVDDAITVIEEGLATVPEQSASRCELLGAKASAEAARGDYEQARDTATEQRELATELGSDDLLAEALRQLGLVEMRLNEYGRSKELYEESLEISRAVDDEEGEAESHHRLGNVALRQGDLDRAQTRYEESRAIKADIGDEYGEAKTLNNLGLVADNRGEMERAQESFEESLERARARGDRLHEARTVNNIGLIARKRGEMETATEYFETSLDQAREIGDQSLEALALTNLGLIARKSGDLDTGEERFTESLDVAQEIGATHRQGLAFVNLGIIERERGNLDAAREATTESLELAEAIGDPGIRARGLTNLGHVAWQDGSLSRAAEHFADGLAAHEEAGDRHGEAETLKELGELERERGNLDEARERLEAAADHYLDIGTEEVAETIEMLVETCRDQGDADTAAEWCEEAISFAEAEDRTEMAERFRDLLADVEAAD
jgi:tetratricopeptide (TPR) repeat protein/DNA-binding PadR family transcriptional regulator